jgi:hypothetical protein
MILLKRRNERMSTTHPIINRTKKNNSSNLSLPYLFSN